MTTTRRRTSAAIVTIVVCAVLAIVVAIVVIPGPADGRVSEPPHLLPDLAPLLLDASDVQRAGSAPLEKKLEDNGLVRPPGPGYAVDPNGCTSVAKPGMSTVYATLPWQEARRADYRSPGDLATVVVSTSVVVVPSQAIALSFLDVQGTQWERCEGREFRYGTTGTVSFRVDDVEVTRDRLTARMTDVPHNVDCIHVMAAKGGIIVESQSCGVPPVDVGKVVDATLVLVPE